MADDLWPCAECDAESPGECCPLNGCSVLVAALRAKDDEIARLREQRLDADVMQTAPAAWQRLYGKQQATIVELTEQAERLAGALRECLQILGPSAPTCEGCATEIGIVLPVIKSALARIDAEAS